MSNQPEFLKRIDPKDNIKPKQKKTKVIFYGDSPTCATGFGQVSRNILPALHNSGRYDVDILGINYWGDPHQYPFKIWPMAVNGQRDPYGRQRLQQHLLDPGLEYDILFFLQDTFILDFMPAMLINLAKAGKRFKSVYYYPIDGIPKPQWIESVNAVDFPVTYTQYGFDQSISFKPELKDRLKVIPHGVNPDVFFPAPESQVKEFRQHFFGELADKFIITNVNRNQQRKDIPATIVAFKEFRKYRPDSILYLHMMAQDQGWNIPEILKGLDLDIKTDVILPQNFTASVGFPLELLNLVYNASDCLMSTTLGEGWGLAWTEAMATKTPVVYPSNTCLGEYITDETGYPYLSGGDSDHISILPNDNEVPRPTAHVHKLVERLIEVYDNREEAKTRSEAAYRMVHDNLIWDKHINPQWVSLFDDIVSGQYTNSLAPEGGDTGVVLKGDLL